MSEISIISVGAATQDVFVTGKALAAKRDVRTHAYIEQFPLGAKLELDQIWFDTGGGATNAAVTFASQGLQAAFAGKIGRDPAGAEVLRVLKREGVDTRHVAVDEKLNTGYSQILLAPNGERTVLSYRGASHNLRTADLAAHPLRADWFYISSVAGNMDLLRRLISYAQSHDIKVAINPGAGELAQPKKLRQLLSGVHILLANNEEMQLLFGGEAPTQTMVNAMPACPYIVLTDGPRGSFASDGTSIYFAGQYQRVKVIDRTGAGDAFNSGFTAAIAKGWSIEDALTLGSANSTSVVQSVGAKLGILKGSHKIKRMKVQKVSI